MNRGAAYEACPALPNQAQNYGDLYDSHYPSCIGNDNQFVLLVRAVIGTELYNVAK
ncbi:unknown protein [Paenibacillus amylolyticus]|uniref:Uncharacterized protein n=1 Tax=Paenibacillus amylolyticus TaxID=1451 RepID=A0A100VL78_PAEAM|nr:unknown protein [Paenibacillus amylolyticus]